MTSVSSYKNVPYIVSEESRSGYLHIGLPIKSKFIIDNRTRDEWTPIEDIGNDDSQLMSIGHQAYIPIDALEAADEMCDGKFKHPSFGIFWASFEFANRSLASSGANEIIDQLIENDHEGIYVR